MKMETFIPDKSELEAVADFRKALAENDKSQLATFEEHETWELSGKLVIRIPKILHRELKDQAEANGVSLNQFILYKLAR